MLPNTVLVTGGASGIGFAATSLLLNQGAPVGVLDVNADALSRIKDAIPREFHPRLLLISCDVSHEDEVRDAVQYIEDVFGPLGGVFANAGIGLGGGMLHELSVDTWSRVLAINLTGTFLTCKYALRSMLNHRQGGSIVCTSSPAAKVGLGAGGVPAYSASKGGISALVRALAIDYAPFGIRVNAVVPGATETPLMWENVPAGAVESQRQLVKQEIPLARLATPAEPARAVVWLLSSESSYVTGSHLMCDGGILAKGSISV